MASNKLSMSVEHSSETYFDKQCAVCSKTGKHVEAKRTCLDCKQMMCDPCLVEHDKFDITKGHRVLDKATPVGGHVDLPTQLCDNHSSKLVDMFCQQHDRVCCTACIAIQHRRCDGIDYVPSISAGTKTGTEVQSVLHDITAELGKLQQRKNEREDDKKRITDQKCKADKSVTQSARRIIESINDLKKKSLHIIQKEYDEFRLKIDEDIHKISNRIASLQDDIKALQSSTCDNESWLFVVMKQSKEHKEKATTLNAEKGPNLKREAIHFNINHQLEKNIKALDSLGELETPFFSSSEVGQYKMRLKNDKNECVISGLCSMPDDTFLAIDRENEKLKRLDLSYNCIDHCKLSGRPLSICRTGSKEVAITLGWQKMVQFVSVGGKLVPTRSFCVGKVCRGIAYSRGQLFITCGNTATIEGPGEVRVYNTDGTLLHNLPKQPTGQQIWSCPSKVALSPNGEMVTVMDNDHVTMDRDGSNTKKSPLDACDMCVQDESLWFFVGDSTRTIYQVNSDGCCLGPLITEDDGLDTDQYSVCYQKDGDKLLVGFRADYIKVFKLYRT